MKVRWAKAIILEVFCAIKVVTIAMGSGCGYGGRDLVRDGTVSVESVPSRYAHFGRVGVHQMNSQVVVSGELHKYSNGRGVTRGHVDGEVIGPDGVIIGRYQTNIRPAHSKSRRIPFSFKFSGKLPASSTIRLVHHDAPITSEQ